MYSIAHLQVRFCMKFLTGEKALPTKIEMLAATAKDMQERWDRGYKKHQAHMMGPDQVSSHINSPYLLFCFHQKPFLLQIKYYDDLSKVADIENLKPVMTKLHNDSSQRFLDDLVNFRKDIYRIVDNDTFIKIKPNK